jgi:uncharacterized protein
MTADGQDTEKNVDFGWGVKIPMRDGIELNATVYRPKGGEPAPAIFTLTPYIADSYHERAYYFAQRMAMRSCWSTAGGAATRAASFEPFVNEGRDGHDVVVWLAGAAVVQRRGDDVGRLLRRL